MDHAAGVGVVEVEAVHEDAIEQCRIARRQAQRQADHRHAARAAEAGDRRRRLVGEVVARGGERDAGRIEHQVPRPLADLGRNGRRRQVVREGRQRLGDQLRLGFRSGCLVHRAQHHVHRFLPGLLHVGPRPPADTLGVRTAGEDAVQGKPDQIVTIGKS